MDSAHHNMSLAEWKAAGLEPETVGLSIGREDAGDLMADLKQALTGTANVQPLVIHAPSQCG